MLSKVQIEEIRQRTHPFAREQDALSLLAHIEEQEKLIEQQAAALDAVWKEGIESSAVSIVVLDARQVYRQWKEQHLVDA